MSPYDFFIVLDFVTNWSPLPTLQGIHGVNVWGKIMVAHPERAFTNITFSYFSNSYIIVMRLPWVESLVATFCPIFPLVMTC